MPPEIDMSGNTQRLRSKIAQRVRSEMRIKVKSFAAINYEALGYGRPNSAIIWLCTVRVGKAQGCTTDSSRNREFTYLELDRIARLFHVLEIKESDELVRTMVQYRPDFKDPYQKHSGLKSRNITDPEVQTELDDRKFDKLLSEFGAEGYQKVNNCIRDQKGTYYSAKTSEERVRIISDLEASLGSIKTEGILKKLE